jgi:hypothetical protein
MDSILQTLLPVLTLILGYLLNVWVGSLESRRNEKIRRVADKEKAYAKISAKIHEVFEKYRVTTLHSNMYAHAKMTNPDEFKELKLVAEEFDELQKLVFEYSLYLNPTILQKLVDLQLVDFRAQVQNIMSKKETLESIEFKEKHADELWSKAKNIMSQMRIELGLEPYPDEILKMWR